MKIYARNKRASYDYEILDKFEAGVVLTGAEVKSVRNGGANLTGGFVFFENDEPWMHAVNIQRWKTSGDKDYDAFRRRKILLKNKEIQNLSKKVEQKGVTLIPISMYPKGKHIKTEVALVRGKRSQKKDADKMRREEEIKHKREVKEFLK